MEKLEVTVTIYATGKQGCGKSRELKRLEDTLAALGYTVEGRAEIRGGEELRMVLQRGDSATVHHRGTALPPLTKGDFSQKFREASC